jgi:hypothetical protein
VKRKPGAKAFNKGLLKRVLGKIKELKIRLVQHLMAILSLKSYFELGCLVFLKKKGFLPGVHQIENY